MKVLSKGPDRKASKKLRCRGYGTGDTAGCGALLLVSPADIKSRSYTDYDGSRDTDYYFYCPVCHKRTYFSRSPFSGRW